MDETSVRIENAKLTQSHFIALSKVLKKFEKQKPTPNQVQLADKKRQSLRLNENKFQD